MKRNIIFSSSGAVYDAKNNLPPYVETDILDPSNPYANTKLIVERILKDMSMQKQFNSVILRYFNPIGAHHSGLLGENPKGVPSNLVPFIYKVIKGDITELKIFGNDYDTKDGTGVRDYIHIMDIAEAHLLAFQYINEFNKFHNENNASHK
ncbi:MAG: NAD-dependent epimerase/dehydratase family protein [bacterium]|nr:NAD-dependent epimerase/dehydratase family protein [bacterium]